ncbi:hypothetical protein LPJ62_002144, partial [Coemansia sp. RSA 2167]
MKTVAAFAALLAIAAAGEHYEAAPVGNLPAHEEHPAGPGYNGAPVGNLPAHEEHPAGPGA